jgi:hypothetical protein
MDFGPTGTVTGRAVGSLIGLLGEPVGMAIGAVTGTVAGAVRDFWVVGVGLGLHRRGHAAFKSEIKELESEASHASGAAKTRLQSQAFRSEDGPGWRSASSPAAP